MNNVATTWAYDMSTDGYQPLAPYVADVDNDSIPEVVFGANRGSAGSRLVLLDGRTGAERVSPWESASTLVMTASPAIGELEGSERDENAEMALFVGEFPLFETGSEMKFFSGVTQDPIASYSLDSSDQSEIVLVPPIVAESNDDAARDEVVFTVVFDDVRLNDTTHQTEHSNLSHRLNGLNLPTEDDDPAALAWQLVSSAMSVSLPVVADTNDDAEAHVEVLYNKGFPRASDNDGSGRASQVVSLQPEDDHVDWSWMMHGQIPNSIPVLMGPHPQADPDRRYKAVITSIEDRPSSPQDPIQSTTVTLLSVSNTPVRLDDVQIDGLLAGPPHYVRTTDAVGAPMDLLLFVIEREDSWIEPIPDHPSSRIVALRIVALESNSPSLEPLWNHDADVNGAAFDSHAGFRGSLVADLDGNGRKDLAVLELGLEERVIDPDRPSKLVAYDILESGLDELWEAEIDLDLPTGIAIADVDRDDGRCEIVVSAGAALDATNDRGMNHGIVKVFEPDLPDLKIASVALQDANPVQGEANQVNFAIRNDAPTGRQAAQGGACVRLEIHQEGTLVRAEDAWFAFPGGSLAAQQQLSRSFPWTPMESGTHSITVTADPEPDPAIPRASCAGQSRAVELNEDNQSNAIQRDVQWKDLVAASVGIQGGGQPVIDRPATIQAAIENHGSADTQSFTVVLRVDGAVLQTSTVPGIDAGSSASVTASWTPTTAGTHVLRVEADPQNQVAEPDNANNNLETEVNVVVPSGLPSGLDDFEGTFRWTPYRWGGGDFTDHASSGTSNVAYSPTTSAHVQFSNPPPYRGQDSGHVGLRRTYDAPQLVALDLRFRVASYQHNGNSLDHLRSGVRLIQLDSDGEELETYEYRLSAWEAGNNNPPAALHEKIIYSAPPTNQWIHASMDPAADFEDLDWTGTAKVKVELYVDAHGANEDWFSIYYDDLDLSFCANEPCAPGSFAASPGPGAGEITLRWGSSPDVGGSALTAIRIDAYEPAAGSWSQIGEVPASEYSYKETGLADGVVRHYRIAAVNSAGEGDPSPTQSARSYQAPSPPQNLAVASGPGRGELSLSWTAPADPGSPAFTTYHVYRGSSSGSLEFHAAVGNVLSYRDTGLGEGDRRHYEVRAVNSYEPSEPSNGADNRTFERPTAPRSLTATPGPEPGRITLRWCPPADSGGAAASSYRIYRGTEPGQETELIGLFNPSTACGITFQDGDPRHWNSADDPLVPGQVYYYRVAAANVVGFGPQSDAASATAPPAAPA